MIPAKLIKDLEKKGFKLDFPSYTSGEERIIDILNQKNSRLNLAIPILLQYEFDYGKIIKNLDNKMIKEFNKIILITNKIFEKEKLPNDHLGIIIGKFKIREKIAEFDYFYNSFRDLMKSAEHDKEKSLNEQLDARERLGINKSLKEIFSPGKRRIMDKIFNHEKLTNTELKYYYRSIKPLIQAILNDEMQRYIRVIESSKKYHE